MPAAQIPSIALGFLLSLSNEIFPPQSAAVLPALNSPISSAAKVLARSPSIFVFSSSILTRTSAVMTAASTRLSPLVTVGTDAVTPAVQISFLRASLSVPESAPRMSSKAKAVSSKDKSALISSREFITMSPAARISPYGLLMVTSALFKIIPFLGRSVPWPLPSVAGSQPSIILPFSSTVMRILGSVKTRRLTVPFSASRHS